MDLAGDLVLAKRCARGDESAMRILFDAHEPRLRALALRNLGNVQDAEEVAASTFIRFWKGASRYRGECPLRTFLTRICLNLIRDQARRVRPPALLELSECEAAVRWEESDEDSRGGLIRAGMLALPPDEREILTLYYIEDMSYDELCLIYEIGYDVLKTRLVRARKRLRVSIGAIDESF
ncbi:MAG: RNA polymerase sigma factor [Fimbriimonas sp.]